jgi:hypothetical protein
VKARNCIDSIDNLKLIDITEHWTPDTEIHNLPTVTKSRLDLSDDTILLMDRFLSEFKCCFEKPDSDQILFMMVFHPIIVSSGFK